MVQKPSGFFIKGLLDQNSWRLRFNSDGSFNKFIIDSKGTRISVRSEKAGIEISADLDSLDLTPWQEFHDKYISPEEADPAAEKKTKEKKKKKKDPKNLKPSKIEDIPVINLSINSLQYKKIDLGKLKVKSQKYDNILSMDKISLEGPVFLNAKGKIKISNKSSFALKGHYSIGEFSEIKDLLPLDEDELSGLLAGNLTAEGEADNLPSLMDKMKVKLSSKVENLCYKSSRREIAIFINALLLNIVDFFSQKICFESGTAILKMSEENIELKDVHLSGDSLFVKADADYEKESEIIDAKVIITPNYGKNFTVLNTVVTGVNPILGMVVSKLITPLIDKELQSFSKIKYTIRGKIDDPEVDFSL